MSQMRVKRSRSETKRKQQYKVNTASMPIFSKLKVAVAHPKRSRTAPCTDGMDSNGGQQKKRKGRPENYLHMDSHGGQQKKRKGGPENYLHQFIGVRQLKSRKWVAEIRLPKSGSPSAKAKRRKWVGTFSTFDEAKEARIKEARRYEGPNASCNLPSSTTKESVDSNVNIFSPINAVESVDATGRPSSDPLYPPLNLKNHHTRLRSYWGARGEELIKTAAIGIPTQTSREYLLGEGPLAVSEPGTPPVLETRKSKVVKRAAEIESTPQQTSRENLLGEVPVAVIPRGTPPVVETQELEVIETAAGSSIKSWRISTVNGNCPDNCNGLVAGRDGEFYAAGLEAGFGRYAPDMTNFPSLFEGHDLYASNLGKIPVDSKSLDYIDLLLMPDYYYSLKSLPDFREIEDLQLADFHFCNFPLSGRLEKL